MLSQSSEHRVRLSAIRTKQIDVSVEHNGRRGVAKRKAVGVRRNWNLAGAERKYKRDEKDDDHIVFVSLRSKSLK
jgi:hypothetical protein